MEWYAVGLDRVLMFYAAFLAILVIILTVMFGKSVIERGPKKYIEMD
jgi:hypothetical protein